MNEPGPSAYKVIKSAQGLVLGMLSSLASWSRPFLHSTLQGSQYLVGRTRGLAAPGSISDQQAKCACLFQGLGCSPPFALALCRGGSVIDPAAAKLAPGAGDPRRNVQGGFTRGWICFTGLLMVISCGCISSISPLTPQPLETLPSLLQ